jgi:hypothetical protein
MQPSSAGNLPCPPRLGPSCKVASLLAQTADETAFASLMPFARENFVGSPESCHEGLSKTAHNGSSRGAKSASDVSKRVSDMVILHEPSPTTEAAILDARAMFSCFRPMKSDVARTKSDMSDGFQFAGTNFSATS